MKDKVAMEDKNYKWFNNALQCKAEQRGSNFGDGQRTV